MVKRLLILAPLVILMLALAAIGIASRLHWGYWLTPPSADGAAACLASVDTFTTYSYLPSPASGPAALLREAAHVNYASGENPLGRLAAALVRRRLSPTSRAAADPSLRAAITAALAKAGALKAGEPGYPRATELYGHIAVGRNPIGQPIIVAAFSGCEVSNDHYPYYEAVFGLAPNGRLSLSRLRFYWYDASGLEGCLGYLTGFLVAAPLLFIWFLMLAFYLMRVLWRQHRHTAA